jgi:hypothetical protein
MVDATRDPLPDYYKRDPSNISLSHLICGLLRQESISTLRFDLQLTEPPPSLSPAGGGGGRKGGSAVREVEETLRMEQQRRTRRRLLKGFSGLARSWAVVTAASCRLANDRDLPEKKLEMPLLHARVSIVRELITHYSVPSKWRWSRAMRHLLDGERVVQGVHARQRVLLLVHLPPRRRGAAVHLLSRFLLLGRRADGRPLLLLFHLLQNEQARMVMMMR